MQIYKGTTGLNNSWQNNFSETIQCYKCNGEARIMFVAQEKEENEYICKLHDNLGKGNYWVHDAIACAIYLCKDCFEPIAILNQA